MQDIGVILMTIGTLLLAGLATDAIGRHSPLPRVTLLLLFGFCIGPSALDLLPDISGTWFPVFADMALLMIGFLLGERLSGLIRGGGARVVLAISLVDVLMTVVVVVAGLLLLGVELELALILASIATATAPAASNDVVREVGARGSFTETLLGIVAIDDVWALIAFSVLLAAALAMAGEGGGGDMLVFGVRELGGALLLGGCLGIPMAYLTGRIRRGEPTLAEALGMVFLCGGLAHGFEVSYLLAAMAMGVTVSQLASHHQRPFHAIENIEWPFMILFFILAGAALDLQALQQAGLLGSAYIVLRITGRVCGVWLGSRIGGADARIRRWMAFALLPQAGVAVGIALLAAQRLPALADRILAVAIAATVFFELIGPVLTRLAIVRAGEAALGGSAGGGRPGKRGGAD